MRRILFYLHSIVLICSVCFSQTVWSSCSITSGGPNPALVSFTIPPLTVSSDAEPGTVLYSEHTVAAPIKVKCSTVGDIYQGYTVLSDNDLVANSPLEGVYATNIPGIGFRAAWANNTAVNYTSDYLLSPWHMGVSKVTPNDGYYPMTLNGSIELVVTGPVQSGLLDSSQLVADWKYDDIIIGQIRFSSTNIDVQANTCNLVEENITVPLNPIMSSDFENNFSDIVSDDRFKIQLDKCVAGVQVDYKFTTAGSTGVSNGDTLKITSGPEAAEGVGIQILDGNNTVLQFDQEYTSVGQTLANQSISIPLKARYIKTGTVKGGVVNAVATFEVYYR